MLENISLFSGLSPEELQTIEAHVVTRNYRKNTVIIEKDDETNSLYLIKDGSVKVYIADSEGKEIVLETLGPGAHIGELALLGDVPRTASVMTLEDSTFLVLTKRAFMDCLSSYPGLAFNLIRSLVQRTQSLASNVGDLALLDVYGRVTRVLTENAEEEDGMLVTGKLTQQEIANRVGSSREMVSRIFKDLKAGGYISVDGKRVFIHKKLPAHW